MACKNCKAKKLKDFYGSKLKNLTDSTEKQKKKWMDKNWDDSMGRLTRFERGVAILFAWIPLSVGYFFIVKFFISLF